MICNPLIIAGFVGTNGISSALIGCSASKIVSATI